MMEHSPGRRGVGVRHILGERLFRRLDEDTGLVRREREVRIEFEQLPKEGGDLAAASVARSDPERAQKRRLERPVSAKSDAARSGSRIEVRYSNSRAFESFIFISFRQSERTNLVLPPQEACD